MTQDRDSDRTDRREFLQAGALATAAAITLTPGLRQDLPAAQAPPVVPKRTLGKTGVEITMLDQGAVRGSLDNVLRFSYSQGVRVFDTAKVYGTEPDFKKWFEQDPEVRKQIFLVTKDMPKTAKQMVGHASTSGSRRSATDHIDLFFIHGLGDDHTRRRRHRTSSRARSSRRRPTRSGSRARPGSSASRPTTRTAPRSSRRRPRGGSSTRSCSSTPPGSTRIAAQQGPRRLPEAKGIGLISMKQIAGQFFGDKPNGEHPRRSRQDECPMLAEKNLSPFQGLLHAIWTDERISAVVRVDAEHRPDPREHRRRPPVRAAQDGRDRAAPRRRPRPRPDALRRLRRPLLDRRRHHGRTGQPDPVPHLSRAPRRPRGGPPPVRRAPAEARDWSGADLAAARAACPNKLDFAKLLPEVDRLLG